MHERIPGFAPDFSELSPQERVIEETLKQLAQDSFKRGDTSAIVVRRSAMENAGNEDWYGFFYGERQDKAYSGVRVQYQRSENPEVSIVSNGRWVSLDYYAAMIQKTSYPRTDALGLFFRPGWKDRPIEQKITFAASLHTSGKMDIFHFFDGEEERDVPLHKALHGNRLFDVVF
jgi:hypothetical protein